ncbi:PEPxxWA-CTERM sorting domain-containing protein [Rugamonas apoptosis]|uniref:PEPxxWA-CTERM sorting domain-containing protein n=1 Tax=Rugamonas apoptosis TaxID=2758570 RepID=A0A7W2FE05_9BURK|nr:PEPxxWA-CTERM sorting domain-containing protein [Rugamonas apoptosis]MBA5689859.1 PEPxxWA-CTERM sorting domain-containing protein [Rugamonas apoptosis]
MRLKSLLLSLSAIAALSVGSAHAAGAELIVNGGFETGTAGQLNFGGSASGWNTVNGYTFLFHGTGADTTGVSGQYGNLKLWGPGNGAANGLTASPAGGNFLASDGAFQQSPITQSVNGLVAGQQYNLSFYWAGAQQQGFSGANTEQWQVSLGNETHATGVVHNTSHGFTGWQKETFTFTATGASALLSFLAVGTPAGVPPFSLLDGVSMTSAVPEPETWAMLGLGLGLVGFAARRRKAAVNAA